jgi:hypothetical protein
MAFKTPGSPEQEQKPVAPPAVVGKLLDMEDEVRAEMANQPEPVATNVRRVYRAIAHIRKVLKHEKSLER